MNILKNVIFCLVLICLALRVAAQPRYTAWVNPFIGTDGFGHTFPGATLPFGMVQVGPDTRIDGSWEGCSGYHYSDSLLYGFSHTHLSGTGCSDYGDVLLLPGCSALSASPKDYALPFSHADERAAAGYYALNLPQKDLSVELTATTRVGMHRYTFGQDGRQGVLLDLTHRDKLLQGSIVQESPYVVSGMRRSEAWARDQWVFFRIEFSQPVQKTERQADQKALFFFDLKASAPLLVKVALSSVDADGARRNMEAELPGWDFTATVRQAEAAWNRELGKIDLQAERPDDYTVFYTALYHTMIHPNILNDADGRYRGRDNQIHRAEGFDYYTVFSLWDTFRALHPLFTLIDQKRTRDFIHTFLKQYEQAGRLPVWELWSNETDCMIGYHSVSVIADAYAKGIRDFDADLALRAMVRSATWDHLGLPAYRSKGFMTMDDEHEHVSKQLEYAYDDWCIARMASGTGAAPGLIDTFKRRSRSWLHLFDPESGFMRPVKNGGWLTPFDPREVNNHFTEGNSWQYSFFVPHDIDAWAQALGGRKALGDKLDALFAADSKTTGREQVDISGLIGQYAHGNEPSHHIAYLYLWTEQPHKTQTLVRHIMDEFYANRPDGLIGNEDCGQMSAWYVFGALGFYPVCPGKPEYALSGPRFKRIALRLENGRTFVVQADQPQKPYVQAARLDGAAFDSPVLSHERIMQGGVLEFDMGDQPRTWAQPMPALPDSMPTVLPAPLLKTTVSDDKRSASVCVSSSASNPALRLHYTLDGSMPTEASPRYKRPIALKKACTLSVVAIDEKGNKSPIQQASFQPKPNNWTLDIQGTYNRQYTAGGDDGIINGLYGTENWRKGDWQGYQGQDVVLTLDMKRSKTLKGASLGFLQDTRSWILMPRRVELFASSDGKKFVPLASADNHLPDKDMEVQIRRWRLTWEQPRAFRYLQIRIEHYGKLPEWHPGAGHDAFFFIDEIVIE